MYLFVVIYDLVLLSLKILYMLSKHSLIFVFWHICECVCVSVDIHACIDVFVYTSMHANVGTYVYEHMLVRSHIVIHSIPSHIQTPVGF